MSFKNLEHSINHLALAETQVICSLIETSFSNRYIYFFKNLFQLENVRKDNLNLRAEINECRNQLIARDTLIKEMQMELADPQKRFLITNELKVGY